MYEGVTGGEEVICLRFDWWAVAGVFACLGLIAVGFVIAEYLRKRCP